MRILGLSVLCLPVLAGVVSDPGLTGPAKYGIEQLERAIGSSAARVVAGLATANGPAAKALRTAGVPLPSKPESLVIRKTRDGLILCGADSRGLMYAALEAARTWPDVKDVQEAPSVAERGISTYTMHRPYFESRLYDERYWQRYFELLARSRINSFVVIFGYENGGFLAPVYPYFFDTKGFPDVHFTGLSAAGQERNKAAFQAMIRIAHERGVEITAAIWDHIYRGGVQGGGIEGADATVGKALPWLVTGVSEQNLVPYTKAALKQFIETFPEIDALQFRMHDESGLKKTEMQSFWHDVFAMLRASHPKVKLDLRAKELPDAIINDAIGQGLQARVSTKYWMEQMGMPFHPTHVNRENQKDRRHGYADLLRYPQTYRVHWQLWNGGTARFLLWADPDYVRRFAGSVRLYDGNSFEVNEPLATKMLGDSHTTPARDILNAQYRYYDYEFERYWHFYELWGRLAYNPDAPASVWESGFRQRFGNQAGPEAMQAVHLSSRVLPRIVAASYLYRNFPTTRGWAEMQAQGNLEQYASMAPSDTEQFQSVRERARALLKGADSGAMTPETSAQWFASTADRIEAHVAAARKAAGANPSKELVSTLTDASILAGLARFHSHRLIAGVEYCLFKETGDVQSLDEAIADERKAVAAWEGIVKAAGDVYRDDLAFGVHRVGFPRHWKEELAKLQSGLPALDEQRRTAKPATGVAHVAVRRGAAPRPKLELIPPGTAKPGADLEIAVKAADPSALRSVRLRYRHLTQFEDYETTPMTAGAEGIYRARIPGGFVSSQRDLVYFVEAIDKAGSGSITPDLEVETPYRVVKVAR